MAHGLRTRLLAAVMLVPLLAFATATGGAWLRCRMTGQILSACCCGDGEASAPDADAVSAADCCDRVEQVVTTAPAELSAPTEHPSVSSTPVTVVVADLGASRVPAFVSFRPDSRASVGPPTGRLRLIAKSTFLI
jgi:hypothetical protein